MTTIVKVDWYKPSGKWYTDTEFKTETPVDETLQIEKEIEEQGVIISKMTYAYEATSKKGVNKRIVIK